MVEGKDSNLNFILRSFDINLDLVYDFFIKKTLW